MNKKILKKLNLCQKFILILNIFLLFVNIGFQRRIILKNLNTNLFKVSDYFIMNLNAKEYKDISKYITNKYNILKQPKNLIFKKEIKIKCIGLFNKSNHINWLKSKLDDEFILTFDEDDPDYLIYNVFTQEDIEPKYKTAIKIAIYTENVMPDLNLADYSIGHYLFR